METNVILNAYHKRNEDLVRFEIILELPFFTKLGILFRKSSKITLHEPVLINNLKFMDEGKGVI